MSLFLAILASFFLITGALVSLLAAIGFMRFPDFFLRLHASSKSGSLGIILIIIGYCLVTPDLSTVFKASVIAMLLFVKSPIGSMALARAAYLVKEKMWETKIDQWKDDLKKELQEQSRREKAAAQGTQKA
ncbi:monovalent cation/H(+) antiporter subunit G [Acanthopleuribacter pedis]|uniref:Monovalent cation/H(+) antiporter subunit G n=1 Tax=Acanthopleuribacter pedis TaxID=442870 RepID=A0A8J7U7P7_9BACT|nr:monovalent cation/H(+) antiporter subunit G [Acanthopleuribacter pedis]MBO1322753.1 monovalent cation/H(+) antiporter subunit G [Acanthopleuribacter pedis]